MLGVCWAYVGSMLGRVWHMLGPCWAHLGPMLGLCWAMLSPSLATYPILGPWKNNEKHRILEKNSPLPKLKLSSYCNCFWIVRANKKRLGTFGGGRTTPFKIVFRLSVCQYTTKAYKSDVLLGGRTSGLDGPCSNLFGFLPQATSWDPEKQWREPIPIGQILRWGKGADHGPCESKVGCLRSSFRKLIWQGLLTAALEFWWHTDSEVLPQKTDTIDKQWPRVPRVPRILQDLQS